MTTQATTYGQTHRHNDPRTTEFTSPIQWLRAGWKDLMAAPVASALLGISFTALCAAAYAAATAIPELSLAFLALLLLASPYLAAAAYYVARQREQKSTVSIRAGLSDVRSHALSIGLFSILSGMITAAWIRLASITFALYYSTLGLNAAEITRVWTAGGESAATIGFLALASAALALTLFSIGAISLPMIADRNCDVVTAVKASLRALRGNIATVLVWMLFLGALIGVALISKLVLLPLVFPLLAYATWHSYRQLSTN